MIVFFVQIVFFLKLIFNSVYKALLKVLNHNFGKHLPYSYMPTKMNRPTSDASVNICPSKWERMQIRNCRSIPFTTTECWRDTKLFQEHWNANSLTKHFAFWSDTRVFSSVREQFGKYSNLLKWNDARRNGGLLFVILVKRKVPGPKMKCDLSAHTQCMYVYFQCSCVRGTNENICV